jgi:SAM-dependent methyltransferase
MKVCLACKTRFDDLDWRCPACGDTPPRHDGHLHFAVDSAMANDGFSESYFEGLARLEAENFWFRARNRLLVSVLGRYFPDARSFLELGCGTGFVLSGVDQAFPLLALYGSEIYDKGLSFASQRLPRATLFQMDARCIPFDAEFDVVGAFDVLEHIDDDELVLRQMFQACRPGGGIMITVPQHRFLWSRVDDYSFHKRRYECSELVEKLLRAGFVVVRTTSFVSLLLPVLLMSRMRQRLMTSESFDPVAELKVGRALDRILERVLDLERVAIQWGFRFSFGGSLLAVARRK